ncbi:hypothetical protein DRE_06965 [Drechslerella stenobrocha 248]|uniref:F-box domain-containing protein n=1 Tax=Drechslerella stenobrocha 248 TaxID=1043628 RepID=W7I647_9PEZI|nr:hypothetical protein DRE_06965 [Drechslerella stenobrocha 248]
MELDKVLPLFQSASPDERARFLTNLLELLRPTEKYAINRRILQNTPFFDLFSHLPAEIALQIAEHLDPIEIIHLRQVSTRWKSLLSSKSLARSLIRSHYSNRSDLSDYQHEVEADPFRALRNLAFREYAGQVGLYTLRKKVAFSQQFAPWRNLKTVRQSPTLTYVILRGFEHSTSNTTSRDDTACWFLVPLAGHASGPALPLVNRQREALDKETIHAGDNFVVAVTLGTR